MTERVLAAVATFAVLSLPAAASNIAQVTPSGDGIELIIRRDGSTVTQLIPLHKIGSIRYFSAGVGTEERQAQYPSFPLKIILVAGSGEYVAHTAVTIFENDTVRLEIPAENVTGPWLFVDLPPGSYDIRAIRGSHRLVNQHVKLSSASAPATIYFRWP